MTGTSYRLVSGPLLAQLDWYRNMVKTVFHVPLTNHCATILLSLYSQDCLIVKRKKSLFFERVVTTGELRKRRVSPRRNCSADNADTGGNYVGRRSDAYKKRMPTDGLASNLSCA